MGDCLFLHGNMLRAIPDNTYEKHFRYIPVTSIPSVPSVFTFINVSRSSASSNLWFYLLFIIRLHFSTS